MKRVVTFGEIMLRLKSEDSTRFLQSSKFEACFGGSEANVAVSLANFGCDVSFVSAVPNNVISDALERELNSFGVDNSFLMRSEGRLGLYFLEAGSGFRSSNVIYDREYSSFSIARSDIFNWDEIFKDAFLFHFSGITPALSENSLTLVIEAIKEAKKRNLLVSCDLNYRKKLWNYGKTAIEVMPLLIKDVDFLFANEEDIQKCLGFDLNISLGVDLEKYKDLSNLVLDKFKNIKMLAITLRESISANFNNWSACVNNREYFFVSSKYEITHITDRLGVGDSFVGAFLYAFFEYDDIKKALEFATAASCLKHSIVGDFNRVSSLEVLEFLDNKSGRISR